MTKKHLVKIAKQEAAQWVGLPRGLVLAILFCYVDHVTEGETIEQTFFPKAAPAVDYEI